MAAPIEIAFEKFEADLKEAVTLMCSDSRETAKVAVKAALEFVHAHKELAALNLHRPFYTLLAALDGLEEGRVAPLLKPAPVDHRPPDSVVKQEAQAYAYWSNMGCRLVDGIGLPAGEPSNTGGMRYRNSRLTIRGGLFLNSCGKVPLRSVGNSFTKIEENMFLLYSIKA